MVSFTTPICRNLAELAVVLILTINQSSTTTNLTAAIPIAPKQCSWGSMDIPSQRKSYKNEEIDHQIHLCGKQFGKVILQINRGGEITTQSDLDDERGPSDDIVRDVIRVAYQRLEELEQKMEELVLDQSSKHMPLLEFGSLVQDILQTADMQLKEKTGMNDSFRHGLMKPIIVEVQRLYGDQLQALRNYYGQRYESILDEEVEEGEDNDEVIERRWAAGAEYMTQNFVAAAQNAVPIMFRTNLEDAKAGTKAKSQVSFDHIDALQGLIQDMIESTERRKDDRNVAAIVQGHDEEEETSETVSTSSKFFRVPKIPKWLERLAARAFVFGVNYIQGWLAWQGIKRAAIERDRNQPKFPLF